MRRHRSYLEAIECRIIDEGLLSSSYINFYKSIYDHQFEIYLYYKEIDYYPNFINFKGLPLIDIEGISLPNTIKIGLRDSLYSIIKVIKEYHFLKFDQSLDLNLFSDHQYEEYVRFILLKDFDKLAAIAMVKGIGCEELIFILINWLKPLFICIVEKNSDLIRGNDWIMPSCPFCGYYPDMSKIMESTGGRRYLHCSLCEYEWPFKRISCAICDNVDITMLGYFETDEKSPYRVDYCDRCRGYIKTVRISKLRDENRFDLSVENVVTPYLDYLAMERGYSRP
ncbi:MAG: formate dehydrogenase accessory protein FdhE [Spirochaetota bacterium]|nr:formate dehydrogenase accessory protein FdhE [Spirochaetota bacterium]